MIIQTTIQKLDKKFSVRLRDPAQATPNFNEKNLLEDLSYHTAHGDELATLDEMEFDNEEFFS